MVLTRSKYCRADRPSEYVVQTSSHKTKTTLSIYNTHLDLSIATNQLFTKDKYRPTPPISGYWAIVGLNTNKYLNIDSPVGASTLWTEVIVNGTTAIVWNDIAWSCTNSFHCLIVTVPSRRVRWSDVSILLERRIHILLVRVATTVTGLFRLLSRHNYRIRV